MNLAIDEINDNKTVRSVILTSSEAGMFCAGADLKERLSYTDEQTENTVRHLRSTFHRVYVAKSVIRKSLSRRLLASMGLRWEVDWNSHSLVT